MYMQNDIVAAATKGPHIDEPSIDPAMRAAEIAEVIAAAANALPKSVMRKLGGLSVAEARDDNDRSYFAQIRSEPIGKSGVEFRFPIPAAMTGGGDLEDIVQDLVDGAIAAAGSAGKLGNFAKLVREAAEEAIAPGMGGLAPMSIVAIGVTPWKSKDTTEITVDVRALGHDLAPGVERVTASAIERVEEKLARIAAVHLARRKALAEAMATGGTGWMDEAALQIFGSAGLDPADMVSRLRETSEVNFTFGGDEGYDLNGGVHWVDGTIRGFVENRSRDNTFRFETNELCIRAAGIPATVMTNLIGRRLREVVDLRFIPHRAVIVDLEEKGEWLYLRLEIARMLIEEAIDA